MNMITAPPIPTMDSAVQMQFSFFSAIYSLWGGMKAVAWTDVINVIVLIFGGLVTTFLAVNAVGDGNGVLAGFAELIRLAPQKFHMIIEKGTVFVPNGTGGIKDAFLDLPGLGVVLGSMWLTNFGFWGFNQFIIQRGLAGKSIREAQYGVAFAGYLKLLIPLLVVIPGIAAFALGAKLGKSDEAYPWLAKQYYTCRYYRTCISRYCSSCRVFNQPWKQHIHNLHC
jgi:SSS family solute:Na+ symporter